ncbi:MAG: hypothetical protein HFJ24_06540 [Clostridia bacterium]|nr:hypothetical protein [Clostridia bacterium]MCI9275597.1 hypothetical protein [Clostridia bacterium]
MQERIHETIAITDLKDMLKKSGEIYGELPAYKFKTDVEGKFDIITHKEFRNRVDALRNSIYQIRAKRQKNCFNWRK